MDPIFNRLADYMQSIGLGTLFTIDSQGNPGGWLWEQVLNGVTSPEELALSLEQTPEFQQRFSVIFDQRKAAARGEMVTVMNPAQVLEYEKVYRDTMSTAGVPAWFYDSYEDAHRAIRANIAPTQLEARVARGIQAVRELPSDVRDVFAEFYGSASDDALLAAVLDPQKTLQELDRSVVASAFAGFGRQQGVQISRTQAEQYAGMGELGRRSTAEVQQAAAEVAQFAPIAETGYGESNITVQSDAAFRAGAMNDVATQQALESRLRSRQAGQQVTAGGAMVGQTGIIGA